jgi:hypothetical protein
LIRKAFPDVEVFHGASGSDYLFIIKLDDRDRCLVVNHAFPDDHSALEIPNLSAKHRVFEALQDDAKPQVLYFYGVRLSEYRPRI